MVNGMLGTGLQVVNCGERQGLRELGERGRLETLHSAENPQSPFFAWLLSRN